MKWTFHLLMWSVCLIWFMVPLFSQEFDINAARNQLNTQLDSLEIEKQSRKHNGLSIEELEFETKRIRDSITVLRTRLGGSKIKSFSSETESSEHSSAASFFSTLFKPGHLYDRIIVGFAILAIGSGIFLITSIYKLFKIKKMRQPERDVSKSIQPSSAERGLLPPISEASVLANNTLTAVRQKMQQQHPQKQVDTQTSLQTFRMQPPLPPRQNQTQYFTVQSAQAEQDQQRLRQTPPLQPPLRQTQQFIVPSHQEKSGVIPPKPLYPPQKQSMPAQQPPQSPLKREPPYQSPFTQPRPVPGFSQQQQIPPVSQPRQIPGSLPQPQPQARQTQQFPIPKQQQQQQQFPVPKQQQQQQQPPLVSKPVQQVVPNQMQPQTQRFNPKPLEKNTQPAPLTLQDQIIYCSDRGMSMTEIAKRFSTSVDQVALILRINRSNQNMK